MKHRREFFSELHRVDYKKVTEEEGQNEKKKVRWEKKIPLDAGLSTGNVTNTAFQRAAVANMVKRA